MQSRIVCVLAIVACLLSAGPASANRYSNVRIGKPVWLPFQPQQGEKVDNNLVHSPKNLDVFERCFQLSGFKLYLDELHKIRSATPNGGFKNVAVRKSTVYAANFAVMWLSNQSKDRKQGAVYQVLRCQNSASDPRFTDYSSRQLKTVAGSTCGISDQTCWNFLVAQQPLYVEEVEVPRPKQAARREPERDLPYDQGNSSYLAPIGPAPPPPVIMREVTTRTIEVTRTIIHREGLQANPGAATIAPTLQEQPGVVTTYGGLYLGFSGGSSNRSRSQTRSTRCPPCPRCQPRPTPRPGGFRPPAGGQPRGDSGLGTQPGGTTPPTY